MCKEFEYKTSKTHALLQKLYTSYTTMLFHLHHYNFLTNFWIEFQTLKLPHTKPSMPIGFVSLFRTWFNPYCKQLLMPKTNQLFNLNLKPWKLIQTWPSTQLISTFPFPWLNPLYKQPRHPIVLQTQLPCPALYVPCQPPKASPTLKQTSTPIPTQLAKSNHPTTTSFAHFNKQPFHHLHAIPWQDQASPHLSPFLFPMSLGPLLTCTHVHTLYLTWHFESKLSVKEK